jgi:uncharacterized protein (TIGR02001 family)
MRTLALALALAAPFAPGLARAQAVTVYGGGAIEYLAEPGGADGGDSLTIEGYVEGEVSGFYLGAWGQVNKVSDANEIDLYFGYRRTLDSGFDYDLNYTRYIYPNDGGDCCGEIGLTLGQTIGDQIYVSAEGYWDPEAELGSGYLNAEFYPADRITVGASWGVYNVDGAADEQEWELGVTYGLTDQTAIDLRYYDGSEYDGYFGLNLSFDTTLLGG